MTLITTDDAIELLEREVSAHRDSFSDIEGFLGHSYDTAELAREIAEKLGLNPEEAFLGGYFHDIGRCFSRDKKGHTFHEIIGARYIEGEGVELKVTDSQEQCNRIAQSFRSHFLVYEQFGMPEYSPWLPGLRDTNPALLLPRSWNEVITVYADLTNVNGKRINFEERIVDIKARDKKANNPRLRVVEKAEARLFELESALLGALEVGEITDEYKLL